MHGTSERADRKESSWRVLYPRDCVKYIEAFRRYYWDHRGVCRMLHEFFQGQVGVRAVCELGSGAGTNLIHLAEHGYVCSGYDMNPESLEIAKSRAVSAGHEVEFSHLDFASALPGQCFDAVVSLFVPISLGDMEALAWRARDIVRPGGFFACMLLALQPDYAEEKDNDISTSEFLEIDGVDVVRLNYFRKRGYQVEFDGVYLANEPAGLRMFRDRDRYDLLSSGEQLLAVPEAAYRHVYRRRVEGKKDQCPPMTYEVLDIFQRL